MQTRNFGDVIRKWRREDPALDEELKQLEEMSHVRTYAPTVADRMECWCDSFRRHLADRVAQLELADNPPQVIDVDTVAGRMAMGDRDWWPAREEQR